MAENLDLVIITGMSGAGKTVAVQSFEDLGYYCIDNMPPRLLPTFWELMKESEKITRIAVVIDLRTRDFFQELENVIQTLENTSSITTRILFLDATDETLVSRYKESRRSHPLTQDGRVYEGIRKERELLATLKSRSQVQIDTTHLSPRQLRQQIIADFAAPGYRPFHVEILSFGFKYGAPIDADVLIDVRFLPNPYYIEELRPLTGMDAPVYDFVMEQPETEKFYEKFLDLLEFILPGYKKEGKASVTIGIGCTGGKHRSVALTERIAQQLRKDQYTVNITHRDHHKDALRNADHARS